MRRLLLSLLCAVEDYYLDQLSSTSQYKIKLIGVAENQMVLALHEFLSL